MKRLVAGWLTLWALQGPVYAGLFDDDEARRQIATLQKESNERLQQLEVANRQMLDLVNQIEHMQTDIADLKGKVDELTYGLQAAQKRQQDLYVDLDSRLKPFEGEKNQAQAQAENQVLNAVTANIRAGKYKEAMFSLHKFIATYPQSKQLGTAYYWLGMSQAGMKHYAGAQASLHKVAAEYADDRYAPDAMLALASVQASQGDKTASIQTLYALRERYASSPAAQQAKRALLTQ